MINKLTTLAAAMMLVSNAAQANEQTVYQFPQVQPALSAQLETLEKDSVEYWQKFLHILG